jgi:hypothetical protein
MLHAKNKYCHLPRALNLKYPFYCSNQLHWNSIPLVCFVVLNKVGTSLRIVRDLRPINRGIICDTTPPENMDDMDNNFAARACYGMQDLFVSSGN